MKGRREEAKKGRREEGQRGRGEEGKKDEGWTGWTGADFLWLRWSMLQERSKNSVARMKVVEINSLMLFCGNSYLTCAKEHLEKGFAGDKR